jgi:hypothetical protein
MFALPAIGNPLAGTNDQHNAGQIIAWAAQYDQSGIAIISAIKIKVLHNPKTNKTELCVRPNFDPV